MVVGINEVFESVVKYLQRNYPNVKNVSMPYCVLYTELGETPEKYFRAEVHFTIDEQFFRKTAILKADPETGNVYWFKEGFTWQFWI